MWALPTRAAQITGFPPPGWSPDSGAFRTEPICSLDVVTAEGRAATAPREASVFLIIIEQRHRGQPRSRRTDPPPPPTRSPFIASGRVRTARPALMCLSTRRRPVTICPVSPSGVLPHLCPSPAAAAFSSVSTAWTLGVVRGLPASPLGSGLEAGRSPSSRSLLQMLLI